MLVPHPADMVRPFSGDVYSGEGNAAKKSASNPDGSKLHVLMVAEKPSIARTIAQVLSRGQCKSRSGTHGGEIFEYNDLFRGRPALFRVTSTFGHIFSIDFPSNFNDWTKTDPSTLFDAPVIKKEADPGKRVPDRLAKEAAGCTHLVLWLDWDREGENICFEVLDCVKKKLLPLKHGELPALSGPNQQIWRAKFSSLAEVDIRKVMSDLRTPDKNEADSVDCRQEIDLKVGCAFTRFMTDHFRAQYDAKLVSYGPCQMPTLFFCVERADAISSFRPETFYYPSVHIDSLGALQWSRKRVFSEALARSFADKIEMDGTVKCVDVRIKRKRQSPPTALNTVAMLKLASTRLGFGPHEAMQLAEQLYTSGYISYPRTETSTYPANFDFEYPLNALATSGCSNHLQRVATELLTVGFRKPRGGSDAGDHPPITITRGANDVNSCGGFSSWKLYELIAKHFLATISPDCVYEVTKNVFEVGGEEFFDSGRRIIEPGFSAVYQASDEADVWGGGGGDSSDDDDPESDGVRGRVRVAVRGAQYKLTAAAGVLSGQTSPPSFVSEAELLGLMEEFGIGTDASMAVHINNIGQRGYVTLITGRRLQPTEFGTPLIHGYMDIDPELVLPKVRAAIEAQCAKVAKGEATKADVLQRSLSLFAAKFDYFRRHVSRMDALIQITCTPVVKAAEPFSKCGACNRYMKLMRSRPPKLWCDSCSRTFALPVEGVIKSSGGLTCPIDKFELILCSGGVGGQTYSLCPLCYTDPPFEEAVLLAALSNQSTAGQDLDMERAAHKAGDFHIRGGQDRRRGRADIHDGRAPAPRATPPSAVSPSKLTMPCSLCPHPTCRYSLKTRGVCLCEKEFCNGTVCLDLNSRPRWKFDCNRCNFQLKVKEKCAHNVAVLSETRCADCGSAFIEVEYHKDYVPGSGVAAGGPVCGSDTPRSARGCVLCDDHITDLFVAREARRSRFAGPRGGSRGRGGRRGRGRRPR